MRRIWRSLYTFFVWVGIFFSPTYTATLCGHRTKWKGFVTAFGRTIITTIPQNDDGSVDYCIQCIGNMAVRCAWCKEPIFIGDPVTLYSPGINSVIASSREETPVQKARQEEEFVLPEGAVVFSEKPLRLVGCLGWNCADTGADRAGFWYPGPDGKGHVVRTPTMMEIMMSGKTPSVVSIGDLTDPTVKPTVVPYVPPEPLKTA